MRTKRTKYLVYKFDELSDEVKETVIEEFQANVNGYEWYTQTVKGVVHENSLRSP